MTRLLLGAAACILIVGARGATHAAPTPRQYCAAIGQDDRARPVPPSLAGATRRLFDLRGSGDVIAQTSVYRCAEHHVLVCIAGANLNCGKADMRRALPAADEYCRANPGSAFIPMVVTGHATAFSWRCEGSSAIAGRPMQAIDARGFAARLCKRLD